MRPFRYSQLQKKYKYHEILIIPGNVTWSCIAMLKNLQDDVDDRSCFCCYSTIPSLLSSATLFSWEESTLKHITSKLSMEWEIYDFHTKTYNGGLMVGKYSEIFCFLGFIFHSEMRTCLAEIELHIQWHIEVFYKKNLSKDRNLHYKSEYHQSARRLGNRKCHQH